MGYVNKRTQESAVTPYLGSFTNRDEMIYFVLAKSNEKVVTGNSKGSPFTFILVA